MTLNNDTIASIITAYGEGAVSIIRISGEDSINIVNSIFSNDLLNKESNTINYGKIQDNNEIIDEVLVSIFRAPKSFTTEDTVEINAHGGVYITNKILNLILSKGARLAEPGEFTKRAFLNGRIDLAEADSIMDMIKATNDNAIKYASKGLTGRVSKLINEYRTRLVEVIAQIEVNIDYPEYDDVEEMTNELIKPKLISLKNDLDVVIRNSKITKTYTNGITTAIIGKPNVGKSSFLNLLLNEDRALVTDIEGTTRDTIEANVNIGNITLKLIDTAGIRKSEDIVESLGIKRSYDMIDKGELIIHIIDGSKVLDEYDKELLEHTKNLNRIIILNKQDLGTKVVIDDAITMSTLEGTGLVELEERILEHFNLKNPLPKDANFVSNIRHFKLLEETFNHIHDAITSSDLMAPVDAIEIDLKLAFEKLGEILGKTSKDALLDELFSRFCLGK